MLRLITLIGGFASLTRCARPCGSKSRFGGMVFVFLFASLTFAHADNLTADIESVLSDNNSYRQMATEFVEEFRKLADTPMADEGRALAREMKTQNYMDNALTILGKEELKEMPNTCADPEQLGDPHIYIFVSSSMPDSTLKNYAADIAKLSGDGIMLLRGVIGDPKELKPTLDFILKFNCGKTLAELQKNNEQCNVSRIDINPQLFRIFDVKEVPAIVWSELSYAELMGAEGVNVNRYGIIYGDTSVEYALTKFKDGMKIDVKRYMGKLKDGYFNK